MNARPLLAILLLSACAEAPDSGPAPDPTADDTAKEDFLLKVLSPASFKKSMDQLYTIVPAGTSDGFTRGEGEPCTVVVEHWDSTSGPGISVTTWRKNDALDGDAVGDPSFTFEIDGRDDPVRVSLERVDTVVASVKHAGIFEVTRQKLRARGSNWADVPYVTVWSATGVLGIFGESFTCASLQLRY